MVTNIVGTLIVMISTNWAYPIIPVDKWVDIAQYKTVPRERVRIGTVIKYDCVEMVVKGEKKIIVLNGEGEPVRMISQVGLANPETIMWQDSVNTITEYMGTNTPILNSIDTNKPVIKAKSVSKVEPVKKGLFDRFKK